MLEARISSTARISRIWGLADAADVAVAKAHCSKSADIRTPEEKDMAKSQVRSNREFRKPKKDEIAAAAPAPSGAQVKLTAGHSGSFSKK
ncbi:hypothetical protein [Agrobacterium tumefaciens]|jgi:hypothetical protein|uniref:hypothetical protein n=1 Tax=Agrobacterium tumefaciens TaxID=358 RepID=UPI0013AE8E8A|nr:hypothetical protein [Agrobacterium tumefaciens]MDR6590113.1 hypothetical protein [Agrobacterium tumefaciens]